MNYADMDCTQGIFWYECTECKQEFSWEWELLVPLCDECQERNLKQEKKEETAHYKQIKGMT